MSSFEVSFTSATKPTQQSKQQLGNYLTIHNILIDQILRDVISYKLSSYLIGGTLRHITGHITTPIRFHIEYEPLYSQCDPRIPYPVL